MIDVSAFLDSLPARPRLLGLGEPTHGVEDFLSARNEVFRDLVTEHGYRSIAIESDCLAGLDVDAFVTGGGAQPDDVLRDGFSHGFGALQGNRELVTWLREVNHGRADPVRLYGFDAPMEMMYAHSPTPALLAVHAFLSTHLAEIPYRATEIVELAGEESRWRQENAMLDAADSIGASPEALRLRLIADDLAALLHAETPRLRSAAPHEFWTACLHARTAVGLCRYHATMADPAPSRLQRLVALRDLMMAENLAAIADRESDRGPTLVFAHNAHLQRWPSEMTLGPHHVTWWSAGAIVDARLGRNYAHLAMDLGAAPEIDVPPPAPESLAGALTAVSAHRQVFDSAQLADLLADRPSTVVARTDTEGNYRYAPIPPEHLAHIDGLLFLRETGAAAGA